MKLPFKMMFLLLILNTMLFSFQTQGDVNKEREEVYRKYMSFPSHVKGGKITPHWMADGHSFCYADGYPGNTIIYKVDPRLNTKEELIDRELFRQTLTPLLGHEPPYKGLPFKEFAFSDGEKAIKFTVDEREFLYSLEDNSITPAPELNEAERKRTIPGHFRKEGFPMGGFQMHPEIESPDGRWFVSVKEYNLWLRSTYDGRMEQLTADGIDDYEWDVEGLKWNPWSPDGFRLAAFKIDSRKVLRVPIVHWLKTREEVEWVHTTKAGGALHKTELYIVDILSGECVKVGLDYEQDHFLTIIGWLPGGTELLFSRFSRDFKKVDIMAANPQTGGVRTLLTETHPTFVKLQHIAVYGGDVGFTLIDGGKLFVWLSERDGWNHLYLYDIKGNLIRRLTEGEFPVTRVAAVDEEEGWVYFTGHAEKRLYDTHLYRVNLDGSGFKRLTEEQGQHDTIGLLALVLGPQGLQFSPSKKYFIDQHSAPNRAPKAELRRADGKLLRVLSEASIDDLKDYGWIPPEEFVVKAADNKTDLYGVLYKPYDFDSNKKYPVIEHIYGGPQISNVQRDFGMNDIAHHLRFPRALAHLGYIVFVVDARGTPERSKAFQDVVYGNWGRNEIPDHVSVLKQLAEKRPYMDLDRVGIFGYSWGGYFTIRAMTTAPEIYHVGVCVYPGLDPYSGMLYEPYLGFPKENKDAYDYASFFRNVENLKGKLLLVNGTSDFATITDTMKLIEALVRADKPYDLILLPNQGHVFNGISQRYFLKGVRKYFRQHLKPE